MVDEIERRFGNRLRELRVARRLTQAQLGEACGLSTKYVGAVERGEQNPTLKVLDKLATGLQVELAELMVVEHQDAPKVLRTKLQAKIKTASDDDLRRMFQLARIVIP
jgi:transcriptional regulator with XRE-family HTH domain